ncbi:DNA-processing protein DprA [Sphingorhabdus wooponensis]|uniref:DNA-protecting protein DprA n=1 Tax=Sphingorhabdus wooponensis TaxID=940136 RepID=A0A3R8R879_9SPHN|nr:DNA-processing protein DprA [Sphingorhabdus wooponensis]RRQ52199.1 DNA-protecting protein DprA [Sphingorhabdus wooponensis]
MASMGSRQAQFDQLRLIRSPNIGPVSYRQLMARFGSARAAIEALPDLIRRGGGKSVVLANDEAIAREFQFAQNFGARHVFIGDDDYPYLLSQMDNAPPVICVKGNLSLLAQPAVALVGARNASAGACQFARQLAFDLSQMGLSVVSGLARGIDTAAHAGSIESGTVAVIAGGIDVVYPPENRALQEGIAERGLLIAEQPPGTEPRARHFPYRNRIIAGTSVGTVVIEAAPNSGSLITARLAAEAGREVMAIPGSPLDPRSRGCNQLIREGATLVQDASEIAELVSPLDNRMLAPAVKTAPSFAVMNDDESNVERGAVIDLMGMTYVSVDELVRQSGSNPTTVQMVLLELELAGKLERGAGGKVRLAA